jgi:glyoxylase-like metal-dependent hydrolase (beta-lactamase superfamily II)
MYGRHSLTLDRVLIHQVLEQELPVIDFRTFFPALADDVFEENRSWLEPHFLDPATGKIVLRIQSYVLQTPHHNILIDTCIGNHKPRPTRPFWHLLNSPDYENNLAAVGLSPADIDFVMCTHLHIDHVGWNTRLENGRWMPTFPKATYIMAEREFLHWQTRYQQEPETCPWIGDSVLPVVDAGRSKLITSDYALNDLVQLIPTPGHTIDHFSVKVGERGQAAIVTGDMIHSPLQALYPELGMFVDFNSQQAGGTRRRIFEQYCDTDTLFCTAHFPVQSIGHIKRFGEAFRFVAKAT